MNRKAHNMLTSFIFFLCHQLQIFVKRVHILFCQDMLYFTFCVHCFIFLTIIQINCKPGSGCPYSFYYLTHGFACYINTELLITNFWNFWSGSSKIIKSLGTYNRNRTYNRFVCKRKTVWLNGWVFVCELSGCGFNSCHLNLRYCACFEQKVPWHSSNHRMCGFTLNPYVTW